MTSKGAGKFFGRRDKKKGTFLNFVFEALVISAKKLEGQGKFIQIFINVKQIITIKKLITINRYPKCPKFKVKTKKKAFTINISHTLIEFL